MEDQTAFSPNGATQFFVSTRDITADIFSIHEHSAGSRVESSDNGIKKPGPGPGFVYRICATQSSGGWLSSPTRR